MSAIRNLTQIIVILGMLLVSACTAQAPATSLPSNPGAVSNAKAPQSISTSTPEPLPEVDPALKAAMKACDIVLPGQVCFVQGPVQVTAQPDRDRKLTPFKKAGQALNLADIQTLKVGEAGSTKGLVLMRIQTEWPGGSFAIVAFGDVELTNEVPYGTREFNPMQSMKLATGKNKEGQAPTSGLFVASPDDGNLSTLVVNGMEMSFGSGGLLTSWLGGLTVQTMWGDIALWYVNKFVEVLEGNRTELTHEELVQELAKEPIADPSYEIVKRALEQNYANLEFNRQYWNRMDNPPPDPMVDRAKPYLEKLVQEMKNRLKRKPWKGGWWKMTYGPVTETGQCDGEAAGDGGVGGDGEPYTTEIPICRGNNGNTILFYESGTSYDRIGPNLFNRSSVSAFDFLGNGKTTTEGHFQTLQVVSPTRMILSNNSTDVDGCTRASVMYLDFVRDDPNVRCGRIIYVDPFDTPTPPPPTPEPQKVEPPVKDPYQVRIGTLTKACDPGAKAFAPSFTSASLSLTPENNLVVDAAATKYELEQSNLTYPYSAEGMDGHQNRYGIFNLQQPMDDTYGLMMTLNQMPNQQYSGSWLVMNEDASKLCGGSIDLPPPE